jgi:hypothetical protein
MLAGFCAVAIGRQTGSLTKTRAFGQLSTWPIFDESLPYLTFPDKACRLPRRQCQPHDQREGARAAEVEVTVCEIRSSELLQQEYENLLTPDERQRREAQRRHLEELRAKAEAELAADAQQRGGRRRA